MVNGVAFLGLATLGLPIALRVVPFAAEAALSPGRGVLLVRSGYAASRLAAGGQLHEHPCPPGWWRWQLWAWRCLRRRSGHRRPVG